MIEFVKMQATGNDYIYIDCINNNVSDYNFHWLARQISDRNYGVGSDGLILICKSDCADAKMIMYNKDGSEGLMCGNGIRCVAKYVYENILKKENLLIETKSGIKKLNVILSNNLVESIIVDMGYPIFEPSLIPVTLDGNKIINRTVKFDEKEFSINCISFGNPHTIIFCNDVEKLNIENLGNIIQKSNIFPNECNVEFVQVIDRNTIKIRVYERGSGETLSCGTGACASVVAGVLNHKLDKGKSIEVILRGGKLNVLYNDKVLMQGPAETICTGKYLVKKH